MLLFAGSRRRPARPWWRQALVAIKGEPLILILLLSMIPFISSRSDCFSQGLLQLREEKLKPDLLHC
jgi:hypothetical protein